MKQFRYAYLVAGFLAGVVYVAACGGASKGIAASIGNAIDVIYDNAASALTATNVQAAIDELVDRLEVVEASESNGIVGVWDGTVYFLNTQEPENIRITFNEDGTYSCDEQAKTYLEIHTTGEWILKGNTIILLSPTDYYYVQTFYDINFNDGNNVGFLDTAGFIKFAWLTKQES